MESSSGLRAARGDEKYMAQTLTNGRRPQAAGSELMASGSLLK